MKINLSTTALSAFLLFATAVSAQQGEQNRHGTQNMTATERADHLTVRMKHELALSDEQVTKVGEINARYMQQLEGMRDMEAGRREAATAMKDARNAELKNFLTEEQYAKMLAEQEKQLQRKKAQQSKNAGSMERGSGTK